MTHTKAFNVILAATNNIKYYGKDTIGKAYDMIEEACDKADKYAWRNVKDTLPPVEKEIDLAYLNHYCNGFRTCRGVYENGKILSDDSSFFSYDSDYCEDWEYDEDNDTYVIPEGFYEVNHFGEYQSVIDEEIVAWRYIEPFGD